MIRIGYLGMPHTLNEKIKTMTYQRYESLENKCLLEEIVLNNLDIFAKIIDYNYQNKIFFYRMTNNLFPLATVENVVYNYDKFENILKNIGNKIKKYGMRVDAHPDHYLVLSTDKEEVLKNSLRILNNHLQIFDLLGISGKVILHIGSKYPTKEEAIKRFKRNFNCLSSNLKKMILLENDDRLYTASETLALCQELNIPMVFDYHHFKCHHLKNEKLEVLLPLIIDTWQDSGLKPKFHISSRKSLKEKRTHHFYIDYSSFVKFVSLVYSFCHDFDIMLESKGKDEALFKLLRQLKFYKVFKIKDNCII